MIKLLDTQRILAPKIICKTRIISCLTVNQLSVDLFTDPANSPSHLEIAIDQKFMEVIVIKCMLIAVKVDHKRFARPKLFILTRTLTKKKLRLIFTKTLVTT